MRESHERFGDNREGEQISWWQRFKSRREESFLRAEHEARYRLAAQLVSGKRVLDIAAGSGYGSYSLATQGAAMVIGVELEEEAVRSAQEKFVHPHLEYRQDSGDELTQVSEMFDVIVSFETIEHIDRDRLFLEKLDDHLVEDGVLVISTPNRIISNPGKSLSDRPENPFHVREYTQEEFRILLEERFVVRKSFAQGRYRKGKPIMNRVLRLGKSLSLAFGIAQSYFTRIRRDTEYIEPTYSIYVCAKRKEPSLKY